jgi:hypothetical protein
MKTVIKPIADAVALIGKITGTDMIGMKLEKGMLRVVGENAGRSLTVMVPHKDKGGWELALPKQALDQTFKGRKELDVAVESNGHITFKANTFEASFATQPYMSGPEMQRDEAKEITEAQQAFLDNSLAVASLAPVYEGDTIFCVDISKKGCFAACFDQMHFALVEAEGISGNLSFAFPTRAFGVVSDAARKSQYTMSTTSASICAWNAEWQLVLPFIQTEVEQTINDVKGLTDSFSKGYARCSAERFYAAVQSASSALETGGAVKVSINDSGSVIVTGESSIGKVSEKIESKHLVKKWSEFSIDPTMVLSLLALVPCEFIEFGVEQDKFFFIRAEDETAKITYGGMLSEAA